ncbi:MAG: hypothetical protein R3175_13365 [Marinobacter sp.]|uniref:hypothetical protein n=1 Tax=Marinobacter sp. TaxID=50741 RepID=UPI00299EC5DC|nr:hypothetical protein [Marinobacter sp.]MDX1757045.1 hypothetical protein [Marinobacter sp.]
MKFPKLCALFAAGALSASGAANAELVTVQVSATVSMVDDPGMVLGGAVQPGTPVTGTYSFETTTADLDSSPEFGHYRHDSGAGALDLNVAGFAIRTDPGASNGFFTVDVIDSQYDEGYHVVSTDNLHPLANGAYLYDAGIHLHSWNPTDALSSDALPSSPPAPTQFEERVIYIGGSNGNDYFSFEAKIDNLVVEGAATPGVYTVVAKVDDIYDPAGLLQGRVVLGETVNGSYRVEPSLADQDSSPEWGLYEHPLVSGYGFELSINDLTFSSDSSVAPVRALIANSSGHDQYEIQAEGGSSNGGFTLDEIFMHLGDGSATALSSDALIQTPDPAQFDGPRDLIIAGRSASSGDYFHIRAQVLSIADSGEPAPELTLLPADGQFLPTQEFDLGIALAPGEHPVQIEGSVNGYDNSSWFGGCQLRGGNSAEGDFLICPDAQYLLDPGAALTVIDVSVTLEDGSTRSAQVKWELLRR